MFLLLTSFDRQFIKFRKKNPSTNKISTIFATKKKALFLLHYYQGIYIPLLFLKSRNTFKCTAVNDSMFLFNRAVELSATNTVVQEN